MKTKFTLWLLFAFLSMAANAGEPIALSEVTGPESWGGVDNVMHVRHLYFSAQPDEETLQVAQSNGVEVVVNLRPPAEQRWDEKSASQQLGFAYYNVPVSRGSGTLSRESMEAIDEIIRNHPEQPILLHCSSGNRASAWFATHLVADHGMTIDDAIAVARKTGLTRAGMEKRVRTYLEE